MIRYRTYKVPVQLLFVTLVVLMTACRKEPPVVNPTDTIVDIHKDPLAFSVSYSKSVYFAKGNLAVRGGVFVDNQWDYGGYFGWGTGDRPTNTSLNNADYQNFLDWGEYLLFEEEECRTLSSAEWRYLLEFREKAEFKRGTAIVNGVHGLILLPDGWQGLEGITFSSGCIQWDDNVLSRVQWKEMEKAGAVFLPASDFIYEGNIVDGRVPDPGPHPGNAGYYWSSTPSGIESGFCVCFYDGRVYSSTDLQRCCRMSVRLVRDAN